MVDPDHRSAYPRGKELRLGSSQPLRNVAATPQRPFTVEKLRRRRDPPKVDPVEPLGTTKHDKDVPSGLSLTKSEQAARLDALVEAQIRAPEERLRAAELARNEAERELANRVARFEMEIKRVGAERDLERKKAELAVLEASELRGTLSHLAQENTTLKASLAAAQENVRESEARLQEEMSRSEGQWSQVIAAEAAHAAEMATEATKYNAVLAELRKAERELADLRSKSWWQRIRS